MMSQMTQVALPMGFSLQLGSSRYPHINTLTCMRIYRISHTTLRPQIQNTLLRHYCLCIVTKIVKIAQYLGFTTQTDYTQSQSELITYQYMLFEANELVACNELIHQLRADTRAILVKQLTQQYLSGSMSVQSITRTLRAFIDALNQNEQPLREAHKAQKTTAPDKEQVIVVTNMVTRINPNDPKCSTIAIRSSNKIDADQNSNINMTDPSNVKNCVDRATDIPAEIIIKDETKMKDEIDQILQQKHQGTNELEKLKPNAAIQHEHQSTNELEKLKPNASRNLTLDNHPQKWKVFFHMTLIQEEELRTLIETTIMKQTIKIRDEICRLRFQYLCEPQTANNKIIYFLTQESHQALARSQIRQMALGNQISEQRFQWLMIVPQLKMKVSREELIRQLQLQQTFRQEQSAIIQRKMKVKREADLLRRKMEWQAAEQARLTEFKRKRELEARNRKEALEASRAIGSVKRDEK